MSSIIRYQHLFILTIVVSFTLLSTAQSDKLSPSQADFLSAINEADMPTMNAFEWVQLVETEWMYSYAQVATYDGIATAFEGFKHYSHFMPGGAGEIGPIADYTLWMVLMLEWWLAETATQVEDNQTLTFDQFTVSVNIDDFDMDSEPEIFLEITHGTDPINYHNYMTAIKTQTGYDIESAPIPFFTKRFTGDGEHRSQKGLIEKADFNADGNMDWLFGYAPAITGRDGTSGMIPNTNITAVYWQDDRLIRLFHIGSTRMLQNIDDDDALETVSTAGSRVDNWGCGYSAYNVTDWDGQHYTRLPTQYEATDCTAHDAEVAMWSGDFKKAIELYDDYIETHEDSYTEIIGCDTYMCYSGQRYRLYEYIHIRRILAHALLGHTDEVATLLDELPDHLSTFRAKSPNDDRFFFHNVFVQHIWEANTTDANQLCQIAYDNADLTELSDQEFYPGRIIEPAIYTTDWQKEATRGDDFAYKAGCDIRYFTNEPIPNNDYWRITIPEPLDRSPSQAEIELGIDRVFMQEDYETALTIAQNADYHEPAEVARWRYWEALTYEALGQIDIALELYQSIAIDYPETPYAIMARLHY